MTDKEDCSSRPCYFTHLAKAFLLKSQITDCQYLIDDQYFRFKIGFNGESQPHRHARGIVLQRRIKKLFGLSKSDDLIKLLFNFVFAHTQDRAIEKNIFTPCELRMKPSTYFQQAANASIQSHTARRGPGYARKYFQQGRLSRTVPADDADNLAGCHFKAHIPESPDGFLCAAVVRMSERGVESSGDNISQTGVSFAGADAISFA